MNQKKPIVLIIILAALLATIFVRLSRNSTVTDSDQADHSGQQKNGNEQRPRTQKADRRDPAEAPEKPDRTGSRSAGVEFDRTIKKIIYSKHARCRMDCRRIDESEIAEIRDEGTVNLAKSELDSSRDPKFALEGVTHDKQHVRIIFAQTPASLVVVTCIDLDTDWTCHCN